MLCKRAPCSRRYVSTTIARIVQYIFKQSGVTIMRAPDFMRGHRGLARIVAAIGLERPITKSRNVKGTGLFIDTYALQKAAVLPARSIIMKILRSTVKEERNANKHGISAV